MAPAPGLGEGGQYSHLTGGRPYTPCTSRPTCGPWGRPGSGITRRSSISRCGLAVVTYKPVGEELVTAGEATRDAQPRIRMGRRIRSYADSVEFQLGDLHGETASEVTRSILKEHSATRAMEK